MEKREASGARWAGKCAAGTMAKHQTTPKAPPVLARRARKNPTGKGWVLELVEQAQGGGVQFTTEQFAIGASE